MTSPNNSLRYDITKQQTEIWHHQTTDWDMTSPNSKSNFSQLLAYIYMSWVASLCSDLHRELFWNISKHILSCVTVWAVWRGLRGECVVTRQAGDVYRNTEARSCNHCCSGKAVSVTYSECAFVALIIHHAKRMRHIVICDPSGCTVFFHITS